ncbi:wax ester synthase/diacylglycerol acyltransferase 4-like isoform X1 [Prosopis cineraria]|uniref:wax ester synthase/diacylglycerol acyltransferase 4-like isoform X1 n=1 Tax=Prosopis cineraria TaxID=364024 RepID=UPI0024108A70|nr:wax ester synthase/diacylglycerol acyltransferase 4-like isoform X1 [Prosopis cineraria]
MDYMNEEYTEPVSPAGRYFNSSVICSYCFGFLESEVPIDDSQTISLLQHVFLPINPRFSCIMVKDDDGNMIWKRVEVRPEEHVKVPIFPENASSSSGLYDQYFSDYVSRILTEKTPSDRPLWEFHVIKYPTSTASGTLIMKLHHSLGDGYSLMGALLSCLHRADDPSIPLSFPSRKPSEPVQSSTRQNVFRRLLSVISSSFNSISDFGWSLIKSGMIQDDVTPIRSGLEGTESQPFTLSDISFPLEAFKEIKSRLGTTNDVLTGMIFYGIRQYMQEMKSKGKADSTAVVMFNTRQIEGYQSVKDMLQPNSKSRWGNQISFLQVSIPKLNQASISNPLEFVWKAHKLIQKKRKSFSVFLIGWLLGLEMKFRGHEAVAKRMYSTLWNSSVVISSLNGPLEQMALANHRVKGFYFTMTGGPENVNISIMSYMGTLRITLRTLKGFVEEHKFKLCMHNAFQVIHQAAMNAPAKNHSF